MKHSRRAGDVIEVDQFQLRRAQEAIQQWYALQDQQSKVDGERERLVMLSDQLQDEIEAMERQWRDLWYQFDLYR